MISPHTLHYSLTQPTQPTQPTQLTHLDQRFTHSARPIHLKKRRRRWLHVPLIEALLICLLVAPASFSNVGLLTIGASGG